MAFPGLRLVLSGLACRRGERLLFEGLDLIVNAGDCLLLTGPNGAGKTSLLRLIAGLLRPAAGTIAIRAGAETDEPADLSLATHLIGSRDAIKPALTCREHVAFWRDLLSGEDRAGDAGAVERALADWGLAERADVPAGYLSSGQRRRLALTRLSAAARPVWLLDEPANALDAASLANLVARIEAFRTAGGIAVIATHMALPLAGARTLPLAGAA